jgi:radical SAM superfamily enzyme YgiQ (UPF0313 family)
MTLSPPLGLLYIAAVLRNNSVQIQFIDQVGQGIPDNKLLRMIEQYSPDIIGFSTMAWQAPTAVRLSMSIKEKMPESHVLFGGIHVTLHPKRMMTKYSHIDFIIEGEGEISTLKLIQALERKEDLKTVPGLYYRENGIVKEGGMKQFITNLDALPFPARDLVRKEWYGKVEGMHFPNLTTIVSSRGCSFSCTFCCASTFSGRKWRSRSPENIVDELEALVRAGYKTIFFVDDNFTMSQKRIRRMCQLIKRRKLSFDWLIEGRVDQVNYDTMRDMVGSGCKLAYLGIESANQRILDLYNKRITPRMAEQAVNTVRRAGMDVILGTFILGAPGETISEMKNTIKFASHLDIDLPQFNMLGAYTGSEIWNNLAAKGYIDSDNMWETGVQIAEVYPGSVPTQKLVEMIDDAYYRFLLRKEYIMKEIARFMTSRFRLWMLLRNIRSGQVLNRFVKGKSIKDTIPAKIKSIDEILDKLLLEDESEEPDFYNRDFPREPW